MRMNPTQILIFSLAIALVTCAEPNRRNLQRLVGGHLKAQDQSSNDAELLEAHSSGSKTKKTEDGGGVDEEKKTLSQQVADGKYGLIQKELFKKPLKQPGIISYDANPEVPKDNINNLGGLSKEDIWLAENHLLVIKGGTYPKHTDKFDSNPLLWPAIDNYTAPKRPVKIPSHPKVPPPFPVQLTDDGPLQILGTNTTRTLDGPPSVYAVPPPEGGYVPGTGPFFPQHPDQADPAAGRAQDQNPPKAQGEGQGGRPFPPFLNGTSPPSFAHLPPGAVAVPPPSINDFDEDDPSIYYPPPYSFSYPSRDNSSSVPAGPLVPGIILPPPPDFFAPQEETTKKATPNKRPTYTKRPKMQKTTQQSPHVHPTTTPIPPTSVINITLRKPIKVVPNNPTEINNELNTTPIPKPPQRTTTRPPKTKIKTRPNVKRPSVTILKPVKSAQSHRTFYNQAPPSGDPFPIYGPPKTTTRPKTIVSSTQVPLHHYYTTQEDISNNVVTVVPEKSTVQPANYYFYEEEPHTNSVTPPRSQKIVHDFFNLPDRYYEQAPRKSPRTKYVYVTSKPFNDPRPRYNLVRQKGRPTSFNAHLEQLREQIEYFSSPRPVFREIQSPRPVYQYSFQASNYKPTQPHNFRPSQPDTPIDDEEGFKPMPRYSVQIQQALEISTNQPTPYPPQNPIYFRQSFRATTERPLDHQNYYTTAKPKYTYNGGQLRGKNVIRAKPSVQYSSEAGQSNHDYRGFYIKPEDNYYEGNKASNYGQRIPSHTTAVPEVRYSTRSPKVVYVTNTQRQPKPISLEGDTLVNYVNPRPNINPDSELIPVEAPQRAKYPSNYGRRPPNPYNPNVEHNYNGRPQIVEAIPISVPNEDARRGSFISYSLPGNNGAHFYFLTPQLAQSRDQGADFYYSQRDSERIRRNNRDGSER
ncbi:extensin-2 isoform X2 [Coccinella septempunctata]|uniref:extensin-2 isoform X2 n=1 Tax=Coccinella septempunctata TaxID=41139 RepID=UPI001D09553A|nr:extensin-2 isoform X2 [Coccinella septempunctata]